MPQAAKSQALERELTDAKQKINIVTASTNDAAAALETARSHCAKGAALTEELAELAAEGTCLLHTEHYKVSTFIDIMTVRLIRQC